MSVYKPCYILHILLYVSLMVLLLTKTYQSGEEIGIVVHAVSVL